MNRDTPMIAFNWQSGGDCRINPQEGLTDALHVGQVPAIAHALTGEGHDAIEDGTGRATPLVMGISENQRAELRLTEVSRQLTSGGGKPGQGYPAAMVGGAIRRLTPLECERLQGFPDGFTCLCQEFEAYAADPDAAALACTCSDSPRYRALGNAVTVNVIEWLGERMRRVLEANP